MSSDYYNKIDKVLTKMGFVINDDVHKDRLVTDKVLEYCFLRTKLSDKEIPFSVKKEKLIVSVDEVIRQLRFDPEQLELDRETLDRVVESLMKRYNIQPPVSEDFFEEDTPRIMDTIIEEESDQENEEYEEDVKQEELVINNDNTSLEQDQEVIAIAPPTDAIVVAQEEDEDEMIDPVMDPEELYDQVREDNEAREKRLRHSREVVSMLIQKMLDATDPESEDRVEYIKNKLDSFCSPDDSGLVTLEMLRELDKEFINDVYKRIQISEKKNNFKNAIMIVRLIIRVVLFTVVAKFGLVNVDRDKIGKIADNFTVERYPIITKKISVHITDTEEASVCMEIISFGSMVIPVFFPNIFKDISGIVTGK